jgi:hypothetical protein
MLVNSPSISCLNEANPGTVDQKVMQSVDLPLLDTGPSDAMSSLNTAAIKSDKTFIDTSSLAKRARNIKIFHLDFTL